MSATPVDHPLPPGAEPREGVGLAPELFRRAYRDTHEPFIGGVAGGLAAHFGIPVLWVRAAFVLMTAFGGFGIAVYAGLWMVLPSDSRFEQSAPGLESATRTGKRPGRVRRLTDVGPAIALGCLGFGLVIAVESLLGAGAIFWPLVIGAAGIALLWRQADEAQRERWVDSTGRIDPVKAVFGRGGWASYARVFAGFALIVTALVVFSLRSGSIGTARDVALAGVLGIAGLAVVVGPVGLSPGLRPHRRAGRARAHPGARRPGGAPARLGAADAGPDPEERRRRTHGGAARPRAGARPALLAVRRRGRRREHARLRAAGRREPRSRTATASRSTSSPSATASSARACGPS